MGVPLRSDRHWSVQGLVGAWAFNEQAGSSVYSLTGITTGVLAGAGVTWVPDGIQRDTGADADRIAIGNVPVLGANWSIAISGVFSSAATNGCLIGRVNNGSMEYGIRHASGLPQVNVNGSAYACPAFVTGVKTTIIAAVGGTTLNIYKNGVITNTHTVTTNTTEAQQFSISSDDNSRYVGGVYEWAKLYNRQLDAFEVASLSDNPWQIYEPEVVWVTAGAAAEILLAGTTAGVGGASANLTTSITLAAQILASGGVSGDLTTAISLAGMASGVGAVSAQLSTAIVLAGTTAGVGTASGALTTAISLAGMASGVGTVSAQLSTTIVLAGAANGDSTCQAALATALTLAGNIVGTGTPSATLTTAIHLIGTAAGTAAITGRLAEPTGILAVLVNMSGAWTEGSIYIKRDGVWRVPTRAVSKTNGAW